MLCCHFSGSDNFEEHLVNRHIPFLFVALLALYGCATQTTIVNGVPEREANEIVVLLASKGIDAEKMPAPVSTTGGATAEPMYDIQVPSSQITESLSILNQAGLPRVKGKSLLDLFGAQGLVPSEMQDKIRYQEGLSAQLATTIRKMDGILDANVQITFPQDEDDKRDLTASVYVKHRGILDNPNSLTITKIKRLVASAVPGLTIENVSVVTDRALYADITLDSTQQLEDQREFVSIWSVVIAKDSIARFQLIFYAFIILIFLIICALAWVLWKCWPLVSTRGGVSSFFHLKQYGEEEIEENTEEGEGEGEGGEE